MSCSRNAKRWPAVHHWLSICLSNYYLMNYTYLLAWRKNYQYVATQSSHFEVTETNYESYHIVFKVFMGSFTVNCTF